MRMPVNGERTCNSAGRADSGSLSLASQPVSPAATRNRPRLK